MTYGNQNNRVSRGFLQSEDGVITDIIETTDRSITFEASFQVKRQFLDKFEQMPESVIFSERSRIARLGIRIKAISAFHKNLKSNLIRIKMSATPVIPGYPTLDLLAKYFCAGLSIGRLAFCDPDALLTSTEVIDAINKAELKLPASTSISSNGEIVIATHKVVYQLKKTLDKDTLGRILMWEEGREILNRYQYAKSVESVSISSGKGVITTCSMYLNRHYIVLQSGYELGRQLPATILDPIKTRGIRVYLEIVNETGQPIVNPLISAKIYRTEIDTPKKKTIIQKISGKHYSYGDMRSLERRFYRSSSSTCHFLAQPTAVIREKSKSLRSATILMNGPQKKCSKTKAECEMVRRDFTNKSSCPHEYATRKISGVLQGKPGAVVLKYFPNIREHYDIINLAGEGLISSLYFFEPSREQGPFLSQDDHNHLQEYHSFDIDVYWISALNGSILTHTVRDGKGYFVVPDRLFDFHNSMLFAFYGSNKVLSEHGTERIGRLMDALIGFWGKNIGIVTGGGSGVMKMANFFAKKRGILSGANFLEITDQEMETDIDFCQVFQSTCRHSRQKWFEIASFPIFNVGGIGSLEELGITLCNMKLSIMDPVPIILFDTEGDGKYWSSTVTQIKEMVSAGRAPRWIEEKIIMTNEPERVIEAYRTHLQLF